MRRWLACLLCLVCLLGSARAAVSVRMEDAAALLERDGSVIVDPGAYADIVPLGGGRFAALQGDAWALMDEKGTLLTEGVYTELRRQDDLLLARRGGKWGVLGEDGSEVSAFEYSRIVPSMSKNAWALKDDPNDLDSDKLYRIDAQGRQHATRFYVQAMGEEAGGGLLSAILRGEDKYSYCDPLGKIAISGPYDYAGSFTGGAAAVVVDGQYGAIGREGELRIPAEYDFLEVRSSGIIIAAKHQAGAWVFGLDGQLRASYPGADVHIAGVGGGYAIIGSDILYVYDRDGTLQLEAPGSSVVLEGVGEQMIISDGAWGEACVYLGGTRQKYQNLYPLGTAAGEAIYACMRANVGRYVNDRLGETQLSTDMDSARYGVVNERGETILPSKYLSIDFLADDRLLARTEDAWQMVDTGGKVYWEYQVRQSSMPSSAAGS